MRNLMDRSGLLAKLTQRDAASASLDEIRRIHSEGYLTEFKALSDARGGMLGISAPFGHGSFEIACQSAGLAREALLSVLRGEHDTAYALTRPPGHHCLADNAMGFCLLANIPIAIEAARAAGLASRFFVIDWDVHHGNGTQTIFYDDPDVHTLSIHQANMFPTGYGGLEDRGAGNGAGANSNLPLPAGCGHEAYLHAMRQVALPLIRDFRPDVIIIANGLDASHVDPLARMSCTSATFAEMTAMVMAAADAICDGRVVAIHEGGYSEAYVPFCGHAVVEQLAGIDTDLSDPFLPKFIEQQPAPDHVAWQCAEIDRMAAALGL
jgi:acetoin utilization deacetylase AcuC-like enzyme